MTHYRDCKKFWEAIQHYGTDCWRVEILWDGLTLEEANIYEQVEIQDNETLYPYGYNLNEGGGGIPNPSEETRRRMSQASMGHRLSKEHKEKLHNSRRGKPLSEEHRKKIGDAHRGRKLSDEHRKKMSKAKRGKRLSKDQREALKGRTPWNKGKKLSKEYREKQSKAQKGRTHTIDTRKKMSESHKGQVPGNKGIPITEEHRKLLQKPEYNEVNAFFCSLSSDMSIQEKRQYLFAEYPDIPKTTLYRWVQQWTNYKTYKEGSLRSAEYHQAHKLFLSLPPEMSVIEKRKYLQENVDSVPNGTVSRWVKEWANTVGRQPRHSDYERVQKFYLTLPSDMSLPEKRLLLHKEFPNVGKTSMNKWLNEWSGTKTLKRHPAYSDAYNFYLSLPIDMLLPEKRRLLREQFPDVENSTRWKWTKQWQSELETTQQP